MPDPSVVHMTTVKCRQIKETAQPELCETPNTLLLLKTEAGEDCNLYIQRSDKVEHQDYSPSDKKDGIHPEETQNLYRVIRAAHENRQNMGRKHKNSRRNRHKKSRRNRHRSRSKANERKAATPKLGSSTSLGASPTNNPKASEGHHVASTKRQQSMSSRAGAARKPESRSEMNKRKPDVKSFAQKVDVTAKKLAADTPQKASQSPRRLTEKLHINVSSTSKNKFEIKLKGIEKDIANQQKKEQKYSNQQPPYANLKGSRRYFGTTRPKKRKQSFAKNADNTAANLAKKEKQAPSLPRHRSTKQPPLDAKQEKAEEKMDVVAKNFIKNHKDSPVAFDSLVNKVANDLAVSTPRTKQKGDRVFIPRGKTVTLGKLAIIILFSSFNIILAQ